MAETTGNMIKAETSKLKRELTLLPLFALIYFTVCGGPFGVELLIGSSGPLLALILLVVTPLIFSIPNMLMVREMTSLMPGEGGYYHWVKQAFGPFTGFMAGWMNWVVAWVDVAIYPVLAATYLGFFFPILRDGTTIANIQIPPWVLQWLVALVLIWAISALSVRGARLSGLTANWLGIVMMIPIIAMSGVGIYNWIRSGSTLSLPLLPQGDMSPSAFFSAFSVGLFVIMWNYMGWELPTAAGDEIVKPKQTYPLAMTLVLVAAIATYGLPTIAGLYGGAGADGRYLLWGQEADTGQTIGDYMQSNYNISSSQMQSWGVDPNGDSGWSFPDIAHAIGDAAAGQQNSALGQLLGASVTVAAILSMIGLFIGNSLGGTRVPFALAEDGMMPQWMVKVHPKYGTPWVAILFCGVLFSILSLNTFAFLVVVDVFLNMLVLMAEFLALWKLRFSKPDLPRQKVPGGYFGLVYITLCPAIIIILAIYSQVEDSGLDSIWLALAAMLIGAVLYFPIKWWVKREVPDVDPYQAEPETESV
ncbi:MAG: APC family permease [Anaerolineaceae bacterium]